MVGDIWYSPPRKVREQQREIEEGGMGYKRIGENLSFADLAVSKSLEHNRSLKMMEKINKVVKWKNIEALLLEHYEVGTSKEGADANH